MPSSPAEAPQPGWLRTSGPRLCLRLTVLALAAALAAAVGRVVIQRYVPEHVCQPGEVPVRVVAGGVLTGGACERARAPVRQGEVSYPPGHVPDLLRDQDAADAVLEREVAAVRARLGKPSDTALAAAVEAAHAEARSTPAR